MDLIFIGTGSGRTSLKRFHSSLLYRINSRNILVDCGDSISRALLSQNIILNSISDIIISHYHSDHLVGLPSLLTQMIIEGRTKKLFIHTHKELVKFLNQFLNISFVFTETLSFDVVINGFDFEKKHKIDDDFLFYSKQNSHIRNKHNLINKNIKFISSSFLFEVNNKNIVYTSDIGDSDDLYLFRDFDTDTLITETTHIPLSKIEDAVSILNPSEVYLTHIDDKTALINWHNQLADSMKHKILIANDGMTIRI